jgi:uncharacterized protein with FMN-binding domain
MSEQNNIINNNVIYRDGIYTGYGDAHRNGNERAIVEIRNGRMANIHFANVNQQGTVYNTTRTGETNLTTPGTSIDNQTGTNMGAGNNTIPGNDVALRNNPNNALRNTPGTTTDDMTGNTTGDRTADITGNTTSNIPANIPRNTIGNTTGNISTNTPANVPNNITGNTVGYGTNNTNMISGDNVGSNVGTSIDAARNNLADMMIRDQSYNVNFTNTNTALASTINNWKLAVRRALEQAAR